jgi:hypothetical protein
MTAKRMFVLLLKLYLADHRAVFGEEMLAVLEQAAKRQTGLPGSIVFFALEAMGLLRGAAREWAAVLTAGRQPLRQEVIAHDGLGRPSGCPNPCRCRDPGDGSGDLIRTVREGSAVV